MIGYEIPVSENAYTAREMYLNNRKQEEDKRKLQEEYTSFICNAKEYFLSEAINMILQNSLDESTSAEDREYGKALVEGFVHENGAPKLIRDFSKKSLFLASIAEAVNKSHQQVLHSCKENDNKTFRITKTIDNNFFDKINGISSEKMTTLINQRVCDSIEDYVQDNVNDKLDLDELAEKTKERIENIKAKTSNERDKIEECYVRQYNEQVNNIKKRTNRKVGLYEQLMHTTANSIVKNSAILESFTANDGSLNVNKIKGKVNVLYTFLEMLNTTQMVNVNESFIENVLKNV